MWVQGERKQRGQGCRRGYRGGEFRVGGAAPEGSFTHRRGEGGENESSAQVAVQCCRHVRRVTAECAQLGKLLLESLSQCQAPSKEGY